MPACRKMRKCAIILLLFFLGLVSHSAALAEGHQSVGLVLSGGGAKGIAHVGALQALEDNGIPVDYVAGTSMGAIVGGLYACGYSPEEILSLMTSGYFRCVAAGKIDPEYIYYFSQEPPTPQMFSVPVGRRDSTAADTFDPQSFISPTPMLFGFMEFFSSYTAQCGGDFDKLFVPFRCVSSNMTKRRAEVFSHGELADAVRASMSFPLVFQAVKIGGDVFYDGGIFDNFPVDVMRREFAPSVMIGFDVSSPTKGPQNSYMDQLDMLVSQPQSYDLPENEGIKVRIDLSDFSLLDFDAAKAIYKRGYDRTVEMMDSIKARVTARVPAGSRELRRAVFKSQTPPLRFSEVSVTGCSPRQNAYLEYIFKPRKGTDTIGLDRARLAFYRAVSSDRLRTFRPTASVIPDSSRLFRLDISASVKQKYELGVGAYLTSSNNSFLYCRAGYSSMSFSSISAGIEAWVGQSYMAGALSASVSLPTAVPSAFRFIAVASRRRFYENEKLFFHDNEPSFVAGHDYFGRLCWAVAAGRTGTLEIGIGGGREYNSFFRNSSGESYLAGRDNIKLDMAQALVAYTSSTVDNINFPTSGYHRRGRLTGVAGKSRYFDAAAPSGGMSDDGKSWLQFNWHERDYLSLDRHWSLGLEGQAVLSTRGLLDSYYAAISTAPAFVPTPAANNYFDPRLRANSFVAATVVPVYKFNGQLSARLSASVFAPLRAIYEKSDGKAVYGSWFGKAYFFGEADVVYSLPFADISAYCNYSSSRRHFNAGISLGFYLEAPSFL